jgi:hypothetical protein
MGGDLGIWLWRQEIFVEAQELLERALRIQEETLGTDGREMPF